MRKNDKFLISLCLAAALCAGCGQKDAVSTENGADTESTAPTDTQTTAASGDMAGTALAELFPGSWTGTSDKVTFACTIEAPEGFDPSAFRLPAVTGMQYQWISKDTVYAKYVEGKEIAEEYNYPSETEGVPDDDIWVLADGSQVCTGGGYGFGITEAAVSKFLYVTRKTEVGASTEDFAFATGEESTAQVKDALEELSFPVDEYRFSWFALSGGEHQELEQAAYEEGTVEEENMLGDAWAGQDEYEIWAWQTYGGLSVIPEYLTLHMTAAKGAGDYTGAPVSATVTAEGVQGLSASVPYSLKETEEQVEFVPFSTIAQKVEERYDNLLTDTTWTVTMAKLLLRIYQDKSEAYAASPIWYFQVQDDSVDPSSAGDYEGLDVLMYDAATGEEVYLNN